jgi:hypothetical protein
MMFQEIHEDQSDIEVAPDEVAERLKKVEELCAEAFLGYAKADILEIRPKWQRWNRRELVAAQVQKLEQSIRRNGAQRYVPSHRIPIAVPRASIVVERLQIEVGTAADELPMLEWVPNANQGEIWGAGGQHRFKALQNMRDARLREVEKLRKDLDTISKDEDVDSETKLERQELEAKIRSIRGQVKGMGMWGFAVYDLGAP